MVAKAVERLRHTAPQRIGISAEVQQTVDDLADRWVNHWVAWSNATEAIDRDLVEDGIRRCYELSGMRWHANVIWVASPFAAALTNVVLDRALPDEPAPGHRSAINTARGRGLLWHTRVSTVMVGVTEPWYEDDLRYRMSYEDMGHLDVRRLLEERVQQPVERRQILSHRILQDATHLRPTDTAALQHELRRIEGQLPAQAQGQLTPLTSHDIPWDGYTHLDGHTAAPWLAAASLTQEILHLDRLGERIDAYRDANTAGPWWPRRHSVVVAERPEIVEMTSTPSGRLRPDIDHHHPVRWRDGTAYEPHPARPKPGEPADAKPGSPRCSQPLHRSQLRPDPA